MKITFKMFSPEGFYVKFKAPYTIENLIGIKSIGARNIRITKNA